MELDHVVDRERGAFHRLFDPFEHVHRLLIEEALAELRGEVRRLARETLAVYGHKT